MIKARHPGKTASQRRILDEIGCGNHSPSMHRATQANLLKAGLIEKCGERIIGSGWSAIKIDEFQMPIPVHMQWCEAMSAEIDIDTPEDSS